MKYFSILLLLMVLLISPLHGQSAWTLDNVHSGITFGVKHLVISTVTGNFKDFAVKFTSEKSDFSDAAVTATINVASISTDNDKRDAHLKSDDFFNAEKYPHITFQSTSFEKIADDKFKVTGNLTIRDVTKKVTFDAVYNGSIKTPWGKTVMSWTATTMINRFDYNLKWDKTIESGGLIVGKDVTVTLNFEFNK